MLRILALETSSSGGEIALLDENHVIRHATLPVGYRTAQSLAPTLAEQLAAAGWTPRDIQLIAVTHGPGSFTGLRIGVTTAKVLAYATGAPVIGINTLEVIAAQSPPAPLVTAVLDAQRRQLFSASFRRPAPPTLEWRHPTAIVDLEPWLAARESGELVTGPGIRLVEAQLPPDVLAAPPDSWAPRATVVGQLAWHAFTAGRQNDPWTLAPQYLRPSAAEERK
jgi:tRNA threonylcarbamoyladenosine biosynthesis protein TsaB